MNFSQANVVIFQKVCFDKSCMVMKLTLRACGSNAVDRFEAASARRLLMPALETEAIILKTFPLGEADRLVSFLGRTSGRVRGVAAGARRVKNRYGSTLQVMSHVRIWYVEKETRELVRIQQCELLESFNKSQSDYALSTGLAVVSEIAELVLQDHEVSEAMFRLILLTAREIERRAEWTLPVSYFAFWTLRLGGWLPRLDRCATCGEIFGDRGSFHSSFEAGPLCENCRHTGMRVMPTAVGNAAERFAGMGLDKLNEESFVGGSALTRSLREASLDWIEFHTEKKLKTRTLLETT